MSNWLFNLLHGKLPGKGFLGRSSTGSGPGQLLDPAAARSLLGSSGRDFLTVAEAELEEYTEPEYCYIKEASLFYQYDASSTAARDGELVLNTGGAGRLIAVGGVVYDPVSGKFFFGARVSGDQIESNLGGSVYLGVNNLTNDDGSANDNIAIGNTNLTSIATGTNSIAVGTNNLLAYIGIGGNIAAGTRNLSNLVSGIRNYALGQDNLYYTTSASDTITVGYRAGFLLGATAITNSIYLGSNTTPGSAGASSNEIVIGKSVTGHGSNTTTIGNSSTTDTYLAGNLHLDADLGVGQSTPTAKTHIKGSTSDSSAYIDKKENSNGDIVNSTRCDGQFFQDGSFVSEHRVITGDETLTNSTAIRILVLNPSTTGKVVTGPASPENWESILYNISAYDMTFARNGKEIDGSATNLTIPAGGVVHIKYFGDTIQYRTRS